MYTAFLCSFSEKKTHNWSEIILLNFYTRKDHVHRLSVQTDI